MAERQGGVGQPWSLAARSGRMVIGAGRKPLQRPRRRRMALWMHAILLAFAPLLVVGFYRVVDGAVERAAARRMAPPATQRQADRLQPVIWECSVVPGSGFRNACRPSPAGDGADRTTGS